MRSLRDNEQAVDGADSLGPVQSVPGAFPRARNIRFGIGAAALRWKASDDRSAVRSLLAYLRACLRREAVHTHAVRAEHLNSDSCACLPSGPELLFSGAGNELAQSPASDRVLRQARQQGQVLRYGYPLVVTGSGSERVALPLLTTEVRAVEGSADEPHQSEGGRTRMRAVGPPDVNSALLTRLGMADSEDLYELRARLRTGAPDHVQRPAAVADLIPKVRTLLTRLEIEPVDDIDPLRTRAPTLPCAPGAHNVAVLYRAGPNTGPGADRQIPGSTEGTLADLDPADGDGLDPEHISGTAMESLLGPMAEGSGTRHTDPSSYGRGLLGALAPSRRPAARPSGHADHGTDPANSVIPVAAAPPSQSQYAIMRAAMCEQLTAAAAPPGSGAHDLVDTLARTAVSNGQRVLVCGRTEFDLAEVLKRADTAPAHPAVRIGGQQDRAAEVRLITRLLEEHAGPVPKEAFASADSTSHWADLADDWDRVRAAWKAMDTMASGGHALAHLAQERWRSIVRGWDPDALFAPDRDGPEYWLRRAERAGTGGVVGLQHRAAIRRELGIASDPESLARLSALARMEGQWRSAVDQRTRCAPLEELTSELTDALARHRRSSAACLSAVVAPRLRHGRAVLENRLEFLNWHYGSGWPGMPALLNILPTWVCRTDRARALPPQPGLFDLVIVLGGERTRVSDLLPVLYRATRALVLGDPVHPGPVSVLDTGEERRALTAAGTSADQLDELGLRYGSGSALRAASKAAPPVRWLDEHEGAPPRLAETASRHCYGSRLAVRTVPVPTGEPAFEWRDVSGTCETAPGASYVNRAEAHRVAAVVGEIKARFSSGHGIAVVAPTHPQVALVRRLLRQRDLYPRVQVGGPDLLHTDQESADITVLSPLLATGAPAIAERRVRGMGHLWSSVLTRTLQRLVVVGDRAYWSGDDSPLGDLDAVASGARHVRTDPATTALVEELRGAGTRVTRQSPADGWAADMVVRFGARRLLILLDREPDGRALRRLMLRGETLNRSTGDPVVVVPAWRCLADPRALVEEILAAH